MGMARLEEEEYERYAMLIVVVVVG